MTQKAKWLRWARIAVAVLAFLMWVVAGAVLARVGAEALARVPAIGKVFLGFVAAIFGLGGLWVFSLVVDRIEFELRGYRVRQLGMKNAFVFTRGTKDCRYEERTATGGIQSLPFVREILGDGYPAPCRVRLPSETVWDSRVDLWARGRRGEITERIINAFRNVEVADAP